MDQQSAQQKSRDLSDAIREFSRERMEKAEAGDDLAAWMQAYDEILSARQSDNFVWIYQLPGHENYSIEHFVADYDNKDNRQLAAKEATFAKTMYESLQTIPQEDNKVRITLKRFRDAKSWTYRAMAIFEPGSRLYLDPLFDDNEVTKENPAIMYMKVNVACINHAGDILYKDLRGKGGAGYLDFIAPKDLMSMMRNRSAGNEFMDPKTRETSDVGLYIFASLSGYFTNQPTMRMNKQLLEKPGKGI